MSAVGYDLACRHCGTVFGIVARIGDVELDVVSRHLRCVHPEILANTGTIPTGELVAQLLVAVRQVREA